MSLHVCGDGTVVVHPLFQEEGDGSIPISPLQLRVSRIEMRTAQLLNAYWHSVLPDTHLGNLVGKTISEAFAATYANRYHACAIWTTPIAANRLKDGFNRLELRRMAVGPHAPKNTPSRFLRIMTAMIRHDYPTVTGLLSYQATDCHTGTIYKASGWTPANESDSQPWHVGVQRDLRQIESSVIRWEKRLVA